MTKRVLFLLLFFFLIKPCVGQQEAVEEFIISVTSNYKNPLAYYPLRQDIFLPTEEELAQIEGNRDRPANARVRGSFIFMDKDSAITREPFITAKGKLMFASTRYRGLSKRPSFAYHKRRHKLLANQNTNLGHFLWYNEQFKKLR